MAALAHTVIEAVGLLDPSVVQRVMPRQTTNISRAVHGRWYTRDDDSDPITEVPGRAPSMQLAADTGKFTDTLDEVVLGDDE